MKVQKAHLPSSGKIVWFVLDRNHKPVKPIISYINYLVALDRSHKTLKNYSYSLKLYWEYLDRYSIDWQLITLENLSGFIHWLRRPDYDPKVISIEPVTAKRVNSTIKNILAPVYGFIEHHQRLGNINSNIKTTIQKPGSSRQFKGLLHHVDQSKPLQGRLLTPKESKKFPGCFNKKQVHQIISSCKNRRDKFLFSLLYESGIRIGEALGLRHEDIVSNGKRNFIRIVDRADNHEDANVKNHAERDVDVPVAIPKLYNDYYVYDYPDNIDCDYVFINLYCPTVEIGTPLTYGGVNSVCESLEKRTKIEKITPHLFRHTHATELIRDSKWDMSFVQKRLGHRHIQTTIDTYVHLDDEDLREAFDKYIDQKNYARK